jgi:hypothetical protein
MGKRWKGGVVLGSAVIMLEIGIVLANPAVLGVPWVCRHLICLRQLKKILVQ